MRRASERATGKFVEWLASARQWDDTPLPPGLQTRVREQWAQLGLLTQQIRALEKARRARMDGSTRMTLDHQVVDAMLCEKQRGRQPDEAAADDQDRYFLARHGT